MAYKNMSLWEALRITLISCKFHSSFKKLTSPFKIKQKPFKETPTSLFGVFSKELMNYNFNANITRIQVYLNLRMNFQPPIWHTLDRKTTQIGWLAKREIQAFKVVVVTLLLMLLFDAFIPTSAPSHVIFDQVICLNMLKCYLYMFGTIKLQ